MATLLPSHYCLYMMFGIPMPIAARSLIGAAMLILAAVITRDVVRAEEISPPAGQDAATIPPSDDAPPPEAIDWNALSAPLDMPYTSRPKLRAARPPGNTGTAAAWSRNDNANGTAALSLKQQLSPFWDMKAGVDLDVATASSPLRIPDTLPEKLASDHRVQDSQAAAWMTAKAPGVPYLSDNVAIEARMAHDARLGTAFSKSLPLWGDHVSVTLRHGYYITQHDAIPGLPGGVDHGRSFEMDRSAKFSIADTGTSFLAGQSLAPAGDRWLNSIGAEQKLFGGLSISGSVSETPEGFSNTSLTAGFKSSW
ncbi:hypothetical protein [Bradyrhizobium sp. LHD-71]|uniref:hypothetical protein n=1 Tax=Bradyrhizobium sp. LHD-71 TaxID=3072141 RepID=UPI00280F349F|nr:hypothetical protein [Bradyrhizobium sp. LHD-71]MDQ8729044.1 hypothetical protein [Bradyrhizobium sp. LHD-71]